MVANVILIWLVILHSSSAVIQASLYYDQIFINVISEAHKFDAWLLDVFRIATDRPNIGGDWPCLQNQCWTTRGLGSRRNVDVQNN